MTHAGGKQEQTLLALHTHAVDNPLRHAAPLKHLSCHIWQHNRCHSLLRACWLAVQLGTQLQKSSLGSNLPSSHLGASGSHPTCELMTQ